MTTTLTAAPSAQKLSVGTASPHLGAATSSPPRGAIVASEPPDRAQVWAARARRMAERWTVYGRRPKPVVIFRSKRRWIEILMRLHRIGMREMRYRPEPFDVWEICRRARHEHGGEAIEFVGWRRGALSRGEQPSLFVIVDEERPAPLDAFAREP